MNTLGQPLRLDVRNVSLSFGSVHVLRGANLQVPDFGITALIGANGAGKTALLNSITGIYHPQSGEILLDGDDIRGETADTIAKRRVGRSFQHLELFQRLTLTENLLVFRDQFFRGSVLEQILFFGHVSRQEAAQREEIEKVIDFFELWAHRDTPVKSLSYGMQKLIGFARAMVMQPKLLLLDEPASGLTREEKRKPCSLHSATEVRLENSDSLDRARYGFGHGPCRPCPCIATGTFNRQRQPKRCFC